MTKVIKYTSEGTITKIYCSKRKAIRKTVNFLNKLTADGWEVHEIGDLLYEAKNIFVKCYIVIA